jgi:hypothetical protein
MTQRQPAGVSGNHKNYMAQTMTDECPVLSSSGAPIFSPLQNKTGHRRDGGSLALFE